MKVDLLFVTHNRREMTRAALYCLAVNTNWSLVRSFAIYDDASTDGTLRLIWSPDFHLPLPPSIRTKLFGGPVAIMAEFLADTRGGAPLIAKIDSDTAVPGGWLDVAVATMEANPEIDLLGIEPFCEPMEGVAWRGPGDVRGLHPNVHIGGIGLMRRFAFELHGAPEPRAYGGGRFGFTEWQHENEDVQKAFINPPLQVVLLDRLPTEPWRTLTTKYCSSGWSRAWPAYPMEWAERWRWFEELMPKEEKP